MLEWLRRLTRQRRDISEIAALDARAFADIGVSRDQALSFAAMPGTVTNRMQAMGQVFGHQTADLTRNRAEWMYLIETCAQCGNVPQCQRFLQQAGVATPTDAGFCPNRAQFAAMAATKRKAA